jgi:hypothetical protein
VIHLHACTQIQAFREALNDARSIASALPGGEMVIEEQEDVIAMLERLRAKKRYVCYVFPGIKGRGGRKRRWKRKRK